jgi:predicted nucleic acid-binding Zn ribbon protein
MMKGPQTIGAVLNELMARRGFARVQSCAALDAAWAEAAGELAAKYTKAGAVKRGKLEVVVANSTLVQELSFRRPAILEALKRSLPDEKIKDLRFRVGTLG